MASLPTPSDEIAPTHFIVAADVERAARFYSDVLGGDIVLAGEPTIIALAKAGSRSASAANRQTTSPASFSSHRRIPIASAAPLNIRLADIKTGHQTRSERVALQRLPLYLSIFGRND